MPEVELKKFVKAAREFFKSFESQDFKDLSSHHIQKMIDAHKLSVSELLSRYSRKLRDWYRTIAAPGTCCRLPRHSARVSWCLEKAKKA
jgi:hypothetical protein